MRGEVADTLQHRLYTYSDWNRGPEDRSGGDRVERTPTTESIGGIPLSSQTRSRDTRNLLNEAPPWKQSTFLESGGGAGTLGACRMRTEARYTLGSTETATQKSRTGQAPSGVDGPIDGAESEVSGHEHRAELQRRL